MANSSRLIVYKVNPKARVVRWRWKWIHRKRVVCRSENAFLSATTCHLNFVRLILFLGSGTITHHYIEELNGNRSYGWVTDRKSVV